MVGPDCIRPVVEPLIPLLRLEKIEHSNDYLSDVDILIKGPEAINICPSNIRGAKTSTEY